MWRRALLLACAAGRRCRAIDLLNGVKQTGFLAPTSLWVAYEFVVSDELSRIEFTVTSQSASFADQLDVYVRYGEAVEQTPDAPTTADYTLATPVVLPGGAGSECSCNHRVTTM